MEASRSTDEEENNFLKIPTTKHVTRSTSLQLPLRGDRLSVDSTMVGRLMQRSSTSLSICASSFSIAMNAHSSSMVNLYPSMEKYRSCGLCRLRHASVLIALFCIFTSLSELTLFWMYGHRFPTEISRFFGVSIFSLSIYQLLSCLAMFAGVITENHYLILPFLSNCIASMMGSMGFGMLLLATNDRRSTQLYPVIATVSMAIVGVYLWFLVISCMTFVLYRDKKYCAAD